MATRIVALFNLKPGIDQAAYEEWARSVDLPTVNGLTSIQEFSVFRSVAMLGSDAAPPYQYVEIIDVADMDQFGKDIAAETMQKIAAQFQDMADVTFILTDKLG
ncbi:REDY-like protein HapK [Niveispirillum irakense]|uniref:REDY-like protein HapK n=1 Tax=Niveispirillum irakense TaxID=34011 RepID=UPI0004107DFF|nr:REDY-like protein HapK [Niveispirillum irakense]